MAAMDNEKELKTLDDSVMEHVTGGEGDIPDKHWEIEGGCTCPTCGRPATKVFHNGTVFGMCDMCAHFDIKE